MCMTAHAFGLFLSIITLNNVTVTEDGVTIHTPDRDVVWRAVGAQWCTAAPGQEHLVMELPVSATA